MFYLLFLNRKTPILAAVKIIKEGVVQVLPQEDTADNLSGFMLYVDRQMSHKVGDYSMYRTRYKDTDDSGMYLSTGEVYVEPPAPKPEPEPTPEEIAEAERQAKIAELCTQIDTLKMQINATDYKIIKSSEYSQVGSETEYDMQALHEERQAIRDQINELQKQVEALMTE